MTKEIKHITPKEYAKWKGCSVQHIHRMLLEQKEHLLPYILTVKRYSRFYTLEVPADLDEKPRSP